MFSYEITNPTDARNGFFKLLEQVAENHEVLIGETAKTLLSSPNQI